MIVINTAIKFKINETFCFLKYVHTYADTHMHTYKNKASEMINVIISVS